MALEPAGDVERFQRQGIFRWQSQAWGFPFVTHSATCFPIAAYPQRRFRVLYSPVCPVRSLDCFRNRLQHALPYLGGQSKRLVRVLLRLLPTRMRLNAWPQVSRNNNQLANLVLGT